MSGRISGLGVSRNRSLVRWTVLWLIATLVYTAAFQFVSALAELSWFILSLAVGLIVIGWAGVILLVGLILAWRNRRESLFAAKAALFPLAAIALALALLDPVSIVAWRLANRTLLALHRTSYERVIAAIRGGDARGAGPYNSGEFEGINFMIEVGLPVRVAFPQDGIGDNWRGVVYDPTGTMAAAKGFTSSYGFSAPPEIRELFGGDVVGCSRIVDDFFVCGFT